MKNQEIFNIFIEFLKNKFIEIENNEKYISLYLQLNFKKGILNKEIKFNPTENILLNINKEK
jgi:hypothetical protein